MKEISKRLKQIVGDNIAQYAKELGMNRQTVDNYLKGRTPRADFLWKLAKYKNININWLLTGEGEIHSKLEEKKYIEAEKSKKIREEEQRGFISAPKPSRTRWKVYIPLCAIIITAGIVFGYLVFGYLIIKALLFNKEWKNSIAVLPFEDLSSQKDQGHLCDGMTDAIIGKLSRMEELKVISRTSVIHYKETSEDIKEIGKELGVAMIMEGSLQKEKDRIRVNAQLINVEDGFHLWSETYDRKLESIFAIQDEIAQAIANELKIKLTAETKNLIVKRYTEDIDLHNLYLKGRYFWNKRTAEGVQKGLEYFQQAIEKDPNYALAYSGIADCYSILGWYHYQPPKDIYPKAREAAEKALQLDDTLAEAYTSLAGIRMDYYWDWAAAERNFKRAIELNPSYATAHQWYAEFLSTQGRYEESISASQRALQLDPLSLVIRTNLALIFNYANQYDRAIEEYRKAIEMDPYFVSAHIDIVYPYIKKSMYNEAVAEIQKAINLTGRNNPEILAQLGMIYSLSGKRDEANELLEELLELSNQMHVSPYFIAYIYTTLGQKEKALECLEKAYEQRNHWMIYLKVDPMLESLHSDPRFIALLQKMGFE